MPMLTDAYHVTSLFLWMVIILKGLQHHVVPDAHSLVVIRALNFPSDGHFLAAVTWDMNHSRIYNGVCIGQHRKICTSALHFFTVALPSHRKLLFHSLWILWLTCCRCGVFRCRISKDDCMFGADAACLEVNNVIQETSYVSNTKDGAVEYVSCTFYQFWQVSRHKPVWFPLKCHQKHYILFWKSVWTEQHLNKYILVMTQGFRIKT